MGAHNRNHISQKVYFSVDLYFGFRHMVDYDHTIVSIFVRPYVDHDAGRTFSPDEERRPPIGE